MLQIWSVVVGGQRYSRVREREIGTKYTMYYQIVGATNFGRPYKLGIYTPRLGHQTFWYITKVTVQQWTV
jgi:hypothetical protein